VAETNRRKFNLGNYIGKETVSPFTGYRGIRSVFITFWLLRQLLKLC